VKGSEGQSTKEGWKQVWGEGSKSIELTSETEVRRLPLLGTLEDGGGEDLMQNCKLVA